VRKAALLLLISCLAACHHGIQTDDAVRQGVMDYFGNTMKLNLQAMDVKVDSVKFDGEKAQATVTVALKGNTAPMMTTKYQLEQKSGKWVVTSRIGDSSGHGTTMPGGAAPGGASPHGGMAMPPSGAGGGMMPAPEDLPPAGKKKE
jgi:hypothetical protein